MALGINTYPKINGNEAILARVEHTEIDALYVAAEAIRLVRRAEGTEGMHVEPAQTAVAYYDHPSLRRGLKMAAWLEERIIGMGIFLYAQPIEAEQAARGVVPKTDRSDHQVFLHTFDGRAEFTYAAYRDTLTNLSDEDRLNLARDVFETATLVQHAQEEQYFKQPATVG